MVIKIKKTKKAKGMRGTTTHGHGARKKWKKSGHKGGVGMAGSGKRGDQKKTLILKEENYFGKKKARRAALKIKPPIFTLQKIESEMSSLMKKGLAKESKGVYEINLGEYKIIGNDKISMKVKITALSASKGAMESVKKSGGEIMLVSKETKSKKDIHKRTICRRTIGRSSRPRN